MGHVLDVREVGHMNYQPMTKEERVAYIQQIMDSMTARFGPNPEPKISEFWDPHRKRRLESMATQIELNGGELRPREISE